MLEVAPQIFGNVATQYLPMIDRLIESIEGTHYTFTDSEDFRQVLMTDINKGMRIYWSEILARSHVASASSILRHRHWINGVIDAYSSKNILSFAACMRGLLESIADSHDALYPVPKTLARDHKLIEEALESRKNEAFWASPELEDMLIHFTHARKPQKKGRVPKTHIAKSIRDYLDILVKSEVPQVVECYSLLCDLAHPGASSVWTWFYSENDSQFSLSPSRGALTIIEFCSEYQKMMLPMFMYGFNSAIMTLAVLNHFRLSGFHCKEVAEWNLSGIKAWKQIEGYLMNSEENQT